MYLSVRYNFCYDSVTGVRQFRKQLLEAKTESCIWILYEWEHCLIVLSVWSFHMNILNTPFLSVSLFFVTGILSSPIQYNPFFLSLYSMLSCSSVTQNWKCTVNSCLQMFLPLFCQQAGYHKNYYRQSTSAICSFLTMWNEKKWLSFTNS